MLAARGATRPQVIAACRVARVVRDPVTHRAPGLRAVLRAVRDCVEPVLVVGPDADGVVRRAIVGVDFRPASARAALTACRMLAPDGVLSLVHVHARLESSRPSWLWPAGGGRDVGAGLRRLAVTLQRVAAGDDADDGDGVAEPGTRRDVRIGAATLFGDPAAELVDYAVRVGADLLVVGAEPRTGPGRATSRLAERVVQRACARAPRCSVLVCPSAPAKR